MYPPGDPATAGSRRDADPADAEFRRIAALATAGDLAGARDALHRLADRAGPSPTASRALRLAAALGRVLGHPDDAAADARRAADLAGTDDALAVAAYAELGESSMALGHPLDGAEAYGRAADRAAEGRDALRRMQAMALSTAGHHAESTAILRTLADTATDPADRAGILIQAAGEAGDGGGDRAGAVRLWREAHAAVEAAATSARSTATDAMRADLAFLAAAAALDTGDLTTALAEIRAARRHALDGVAVVQYIAAAVAEAAVAELVGDDPGAYGSLATGYATLGDVVGRALSGSTFDGPLRALRDRWGPDRFGRAKRAYEEARRRTGSVR